MSIIKDIKAQHNFDWKNLSEIVIGKSAHSKRKALHILILFLMKNYIFGAYNDLVGCNMTLEGVPWLCEVVFWLSMDV